MTYFNIITIYYYYVCKVNKKVCDLKVDLFFYSFGYFFKYISCFYIYYTIGRNFG